LKHWQSTKQAFQKETSPHNEIIWNNRNIKIDGKAPFYKNWFENDIVLIEDLLHNDGKFLSFNEFSEKFHLETPFTFYFGLINAIPTNLKLGIKRTPRQTSEDENNINTISTKNVYSVMLNKRLFTPHRGKQNFKAQFYPRKHKQSL